MFGIVGGFAGAVLKAVGQTIADGSDSMPNLKRLGLGMNELGDTLAAPSTPNRSTEIASVNSENASTSILGSIGNWISGSGAGVQRSEVAAVGVGEKLGRSAAHHNGTFVHAPLGRFDHNPAEAFQVPNVGLDAAMAQARAAMAGAMSA